MDLLKKKKKIFHNPYSTIHPGYLFYIKGKIFDSDSDIHKAINLFDEAYNFSMKNQEYEDAGEFLILEMKAEGLICSDIFHKTYKKTKKIYKNLAKLKEDPYYVHSLIDIENLREKYFDKRLSTNKKENLFRELAKRYLKEVDKYAAEELMNLKIINLFEAFLHLNKIEKTLTEKDKKRRENLVSKLIFDISEMKRLLKKEEFSISEYGNLRLKCNLDYLLGKLHHHLREKSDSVFFLKKALKGFYELLNNPYLENIIYRSEKKLYQHKNCYKIHHLKIHSDKKFQEILYLTERIEILDSLHEILLELTNYSINTDLINKENINKDQLDTYLMIIEAIIGLVKNLESSGRLDEHMHTKYSAVQLYYYYQIYKIMEKKMG